MSPIQQMLLGAGGAVASKNWIDDCFSTFLYKGNSSTQSINNGIDLSGEGGLTWIKARNDAVNHFLYDTERGAGKQLHSNTNNDEHTDTNQFSSFNNNGFSLGNNAYTNDSSYKYSSWTFRKSPMFDVVTYTGNGDARTISHSLGSIPGSIWIKCTSQTQDWVCYHRGSNASPEDYVLRLNDSNAAFSAAAFNNTLPTSTNFSLGTAGSINGNGETYVAYLFAGGESTAATARSVDFDGSDDKLTISDDSDLDAGSGDYTVECFFKQTAAYTNYLSILAKSGGSLGYWLQTDSSGKLLGGEHGSTFITSTTTFARGVWNHAALVRQSGTMYLYLNGRLEGSVAGSSYSDNNEVFGIGVLEGHGRWFGGKISNVRFVKGTAVYTSSFRVPTEPLTNITNTKLLCCNNSSTTGATVTPGTITAGSSPTASSDSPFDDPAGFVFGDAGDQNVIKCGSYVGNGNADGPEINLGWEPQWVLIKNSSSGSNSWNIWDSMRGIVTGGNDIQLYTDREQEEYTGADRVDLTPTGFKLKQNNSLINTDGDTYLYMCIRRPDGYVGKPPELGTGVFAMDTGNSSSTEAFTSGFPVDYVLATNPSSTSVYNWETGGRLIQGKYLYTHNNDTEASHANFDFTSNTGWSKNSGYNSTYQSWMWKRHAGFDVVTYTGDGVAGRQINHSMNKAVEMLWVKTRDSTENWIVGHKGLNGGSDPWDYEIALNSNDEEANNVNKWNDTAPTSSHFTLGNGDAVNKDGDDYIAMLFSTTDVSKVGYYAGNGSTGQTITTGFQPRFIIIKNIDQSGKAWIVLDTVRGWASGSDTYLLLNETTAQGTNNFGNPTSTGFYLDGGGSSFNGSGKNYIYYAHA